MTDKRLYLVLSLMVLVSVVATGCGATPTPTATPVPPTKAPVVPTAVPPTAVPPTVVPPTAVPPTAVPPTATKPPATATPVPPTATAAPKPTPFPLKVGTDATFKPMEFKDEKTGAIIGFDVDLVNAVCAEIGCTATFENINFDGIFIALGAKKFDVVASAVTITDERQKQYLFSDPYINAGQILAVRSADKVITSTDAITKANKIGVQLGTTGEEQAQKICQKVGCTVKSYDDITLAFTDLAASRVDAVINDSPITADYIASNPTANLKTVGKVFTDENYGIVLRQDSADLQGKINAALKKIKDSGKLTEIIKKWGLVQ
jgi:ABC-type amino acid transport substrate-binding protein